MLPKRALEDGTPHNGKKLKESASHTIGWYTHQGGRQTNEDRFQVHKVQDDNCSPEMTFIGVYDGHKGSECAEYLQNSLHVTFQSAISTGDKEVLPQNIEAALLQAFISTDQVFLDNSSSPSGACAVVAIVEGSEEVTIAHCGDCRALLITKKTARMLTVDHRMSDLLSRSDDKARAELGRISNAGGRIQGGTLEGLAVYRAFGDRVLKAPHQPKLTCYPDVRVENLTDQDPFALLLATDGVWDVLSTDIAAHFCRDHLLKGDDPSEVARKLVEYSAQQLRLSPLDNMTVVLLQF
ncbi:hypothetical protein CYMTET_28066 [Cymbomonas tetramitiformis]|uniref:PPM-type phosphatase domain-containing protein n=1 Tax=Cymbomonas tetramitiformis TaxID=36881 RepID=A0AAE0FNI6_9CHLO|nr:hypothetical protein CYMTET_28066 [Cymbomonas tetramitiformis]|eukprot:gene23037-27875_t